MEHINSFIHGPFYILNSLVQLSINSFLLLYKIPHHLAQIHDRLAQQVMRLVAAAAERWTHTVAAVVHLGEHLLEV